MSRKHGLLVLWYLVVALTVVAVYRTVYTKPTPPSKLDNAHDFQSRLDDFNRRITLDAYLSKGNKKTKWDHDAVKFLELFLKWESTGFNTEGKGSTCELAHKLTSSGCTDPIVLTCLVISEGKNHNNLELSHFEMLNKALMGFHTGRYNTGRAHYIPIYLWEYSKTKNTSMQNIQQELCADLITTALTDGSYRPRDTRFIIATMNPPNTKLFKAERERVPYAPSIHKLVSDRIKSDMNVDPYIRLLLAGWSEDIYYGAFLKYDAGTDESWNDLLRREKNAESLLERAYKLHPEYPEAPTILISVTRHFDNPASPLKWFRLATKAQIDYGPAYELIRSCYGRPANLELGELRNVVSELGENTRYDTEAPFQTIITLKYMYDSASVSNLYATPKQRHQSAVCFLGEPICREAMTRVFRGYNRSAPEEMKTLYMVYNAGMNVLAERYPEAATIFRKIGTNVDQKSLDKYAEFFNRNYETDMNLAFSKSRVDIHLAVR